MRLLSKLHYMVHYPAQGVFAHSLEKVGEAKAATPH
jgi:hypothetical protein